MKFKVLYPPHRTRRQSATMWLRCGCELHKCANRVQAWTRVNKHTCCIVRGSRLIRWSNKCGTAVAAARNHERRADICSVLAPEEIEISFEEFPQADTGLQASIVQQKHPARGAVCANDALVAVKGQQYTYELPLRRHSSSWLASPGRAKRSRSWSSPGATCSPLGPSRLELDKPVIAAIEGPAVAGGMEIGLWCDFRVMAEGCKHPE